MSGEVYLGGGGDGAENLEGIPSGGYYQTSGVFVL